jgi:hexosaminidase
MPVENIKRTIDALSFNKFNRLHLHVTDAQAWPLEIPAIPELSAKGAYRPDYVYTVEDFKDLMEYAALQGVQLITEIDSPGHLSSVGYSHPELVAAFDQQPNWGIYAAEPPSGTLKLNSTAVYKFMKTVYDDLLPRVRSYSSYFHSGGDEVKAAAYKLDDTINSGKVSVITPYLQKFVNKMHGHIRKMGLTPIAWEEMLLEWDLDLGKDVLVQTWQSDEAVLQTVNKGHKALAGNYNYWYLDCGRGQWLDFERQDAASFWPFLDYCDPVKNWRLVYSYDPLTGIPADKHHLVVGGEVHLWNEQTDPANLDGKLWPRAAAAGEVLWSGAKDAQGQNRSQVTASPRLSEMRERLLAKGVAAEPIQMPYCLMYPESCVYHA